jgi:hypothetical protein
MSDLESGEWLGHMDKIFTHPVHGSFGAVGRGEDVHAFFAWVRDGIRKPDLVESINAIQVAVDGELYFWTDFDRVRTTDSPFLAIGAGRLAALGAMEKGATAVEAVEIACKYVASCGLPVKSISTR